MATIGLLARTSNNRFRGVLHSGLALAAMVFCLSFFPVIPVWTPMAQAAESAADPAAAAQKLQLEGARLQLQGHLDAAIKKYRQSLSLQPNQRLDSLVLQLEAQVGQQEGEGAPTPAPVQSAPVLASPQPAAPEPGSATKPESPSEQAQPAVPAVVDQIPAAQPHQGETTPPERVEPAPAAVTAEASVPSTPPAGDAPVSGEVKSGPVEAPVAGKRAPGTAEEELIFAFTDWALHFFPPPGSAEGFSLTTNRNYVIDRADGQYSVRLEPCVLAFGENSTVDLGPVLLRLQPRDADTLAVSLTLPQKVPVLSAGKTIAELTIGTQEISGVWSRTLADFTRSDLKLLNLVLQESGTGGRMTVEQVIMGSSFSGEQGKWTDKMRGELGGLRIVDPDLEVAIDAMTMQADVSGIDPQRYTQLRQRFQGVASRLEETDLPAMRQLVGDIEQYLQIFRSYTGSGTVKGVRAKSAEAVFNLEAIDFSGRLHREEPGGRYVYHSGGTGTGITFNEVQKPEKPQPVAAKLEQVTFTGEGSLQPIPAALFADLTTALDGIAQVPEQEVDAYLARHGTLFGKKILALIEGYSSEISVKGGNIENVQPAPISLAAAKVGGGFKAGSGEGGTIHTLISFSGLKGLAAETRTAPESAHLLLEVQKIPSLLSLLPGEDVLATANMQQVQGQVMMKGMNALMTSGMTLALKDTFIAFPASRLDMGLLATVDQGAKYVSTGTMNVAIENPDEFMRIVRTYSADPETAKMLATLTALADRSTENGTITDRVEARMDKEGKVFINAKDVTPMFFPPPAPVERKTNPGSAQ
jgi:hypothetical protein